MILSDADKLSVMNNIKDAFKKLDKFSYPTIHLNLQNDETKYAIIERIINELYARDYRPDLLQIFNAMEITLSE